MENSILKHFLDLCPNFELFNSLVNDHNYDDIDYKHILLFLGNCKSTPIELGHQVFTFEELKILAEQNRVALSLFEGIDLLEKFNQNKVSQIILLIENEDLILEKIKDQFIDICKDRHITMVLPNLSKKFKSKTVSTELITTELLKDAVAIVIENCSTYKYLQNFLKDGINLEEFSRIDQSFA